MHPGSFKARPPLFPGRLATSRCCPGGLSYCSTITSTPQARALRNAQVRWTPQLHKAFQDAVDALGPGAVPAAVLERMGPCAAGLTRDAVASHLQKHRSGYAPPAP